MDPELERLARSRKSKSGRARGHNASRDFHRWVHRAGKTFQVNISKVKIPRNIKKKNKFGRKVNTDTVMMHSVIHLSSWLEAVMKTFPDFFLGGYSFLDDHLWMNMFGDFWKHFRSVCPSHPIYSKTEAERSCTIPFAIHGDEGRGLSKVPLMVISFQVLIPSSGPENLSSTQCLGAWGWIFCGGVPVAKVKVPRNKYFFFQSGCMIEAFLHHKTPLYFDPSNMVFTQEVHNRCIEP